MRKSFHFHFLLFGFLLSACTPRQAAHPGPEGAKKHAPGPIGHRFEDAEEWAPRWEEPSRDVWQKPREVVALLRLAPGMVVADLGAGTGYFLSYLSLAVGEEGKILALDIEPDMIRYMKERAGREGMTNVVPTLVPYDDPSLPPGTVHRILTVNTWHHIPDRIQYVKKLEQGLLPGGMIFVVDFTLESDIGPSKKHRLPPEEVAEELRAAGLEAEIVKELLPKQYVVIGKKKGN